MRLGIIGGGQLARMLILAGVPMGMKFVVFTSKISASTQTLAEHVVGDFDDADAVNRFINSVDVITYENENCPPHFMRLIEMKKKLFPNTAVLRQTQDRMHEKALFETLDIPVHPYCGISTQHDLQVASETLGFPFVMKACRNGYDGKHQRIIRNKETLRLASDELEKLGDSQTEPVFIAEAFVDFDYEVSIVGARNQQGQLAFYALCENEHRQGMLYKTQPQADHPLWGTAKEYLTRIMEHFDYIGVGTLELFVKDNQLLANEFAPRVHNSGHWTIEGAETSQFENHIRAISGLPLGSTQLINHCMLFNCIGKMPAFNQVLTIPNAYYHDYKKTPRDQRKLGHITLISKDTETLAKHAQSLTSLLKGFDGIDI